MNVYFADGSLPEELFEHNQALLEFFLSVQEEADEHMGSSKSPPVLFRSSGLFSSPNSKGQNPPVSFAQRGAKVLFLFFLLLNPINPDDLPLMIISQAVSPSIHVSTGVCVCLSRAHLSLQIAHPRPCRRMMTLQIQGCSSAGSQTPLTGTGF